ncbi:MAG: Fe-S cluster assembly protein SufD [Thermoplasmata archaeon]|jgi:Fe-S cluster assembly protein SufD|nr:Fe-S cluster assembly protein SufD [Thermoplasmata archaeon]
MTARQATVTNPPAHAPYVAEFKAGNWARRGPEFVREARAAAIAQFEAGGFPTTRLEAWKHTSVRPITLQHFRPLPGPARAVAEPEIAPYRIAGSHELVFVDGHFVSGLSLLGDLPRGLTVQSLAASLARPSDALEHHLARHADNDAPFVALNTAFLQDGGVVVASPGTLAESPVHLLHLSTEPRSPAASHVRHLVVAGAGAQLTVVQSFVGLPSGDPSLTTAVTELVAGPGAHVSHVRLQRENPHGFHVGHLAIRQDRDAVVRDFLFSVGAALSRNEAHAILGAPGAEIHLDGLFLGTGNQHVDCPTYIDHAVHHTTSHQVYKGVLDGAARGVFLGNVKVRADAQKTNADQTNRNLLLSTRALVDTTPQLEIHADDVKCSHGSTIGQLSKDATFFLRSRGIDEEHARLMLTQAFAAEVLEKAPPRLRTLLDGLLAQWFACRRVQGMA